MSDTDLKGQENAEEQTATPMPSEDKPVEGTEEPTLPDGVKERTAEEFEKLKEANKSLKAELETLKGSNSFQFVPPMLDEIQPNQDSDTEVPDPSAGATSSSGQNFVDEGGYVDTALLNSTLTKAQKEAAEAKAAVARLQQERQAEKTAALKQQAFTEFKEFVAEDGGSFVPEFDHKVKLELTRQLIEEGKQDYIKAARTVKGLYYPASNAPAEVENKETISQREQASAQTSTSKGSEEPIDHDDLVAGTMAGDADAIFKRLQASGNQLNKEGGEI